MSGDSFEYLRQYLLGKGRREAIETIANRLDHVGSGTWAALQTRYVLALLDDANQRIEQLDKVWKAVERHDSGDGGPEQVEQAIAKHEPRDERPPYFL
ncbi:hypothetical protein [Actinophytocola sp.]|uniref:hypothetical protein n=1 Tax=Actinophytocola sp. TaxID=1872138 RepID=UPI002ED5B693